jgi:hypothetical protein
VVLARLFLALLRDTFRETDCCMMKVYLVTSRKCTYHKNDSPSFAFLIMDRSGKP